MYVIMLCMYVFMHACTNLCEVNVLCIFMCKKKCSVNLNKYACLYIYIYIYMCVCVSSFYVDKGTLVLNLHGPRLLIHFMSRLGSSLLRSFGLHLKRKRLLLKKLLKLQLQFLLTQLRICLFLMVLQY